jgi:hypothetical protein
MIIKQDLTAKNIIIGTLIFCAYVSCICLLIKMSDIPLVQWFSFGIISGVFLFLEINKGEDYKKRPFLNTIFLIFISAGGWATFGLLCAGLALGTVKRNFVKIAFAIIGIAFIYNFDHPLHF